MLGSIVQEGKSCTQWYLLEVAFARSSVSDQNKTMSSESNVFEVRNALEIMLVREDTMLILLEPLK